MTDKSFPRFAPAPLEARFVPIRPTLPFPAPIGRHFFGEEKSPGAHSRRPGPPPGEPSSRRRGFSAVKKGPSFPIHDGDDVRDRPDPPPSQEPEQAMI